MANAAFGYKVNKDGSLGIDFYVNGRPATNTDFYNATGISEQALYQQNVLPKATSTTYPVEALYSAANKAENQTQSYSPGSGQTAATYTPEQMALAKEKYDRDKASLERAKQAKMLEFDQMMSDLEDQGKKLGVSKEEGLSSNQAYFNNISPDVYQGVNTRYNQKVLDAYNQGLETVGKNKEKVGLSKNNYLADLADQQWGLDANYNAMQGSYNGGGVQAVGATAPQLETTNIYDPSVQAARLNGASQAGSPNVVAVDPNAKIAQDIYSYLYGNSNIAKYK